jgi:LacI family transcriptional regulator
MAARHLIELGHERIAIITGNLRLSPHADRLEGFRRAMQEAGLAVREEYLRPGNPEIEAGRRAGLDLTCLPAPPTAIICSNNRMLLGLMRAIGERGLACPDQLSVIGFDDYAWTEHFTPRLTVVAQRTYEMGAKAMEMLLDRMRQPAAKEGLAPGSIVLEAELRVRESTSVPPPP